MSSVFVLPELVNSVEDQHRANLDKWGHQHPETLQPVLMEEVGEVSQAFLQSYYGNGTKSTGDLREECVQAMAVLVELYQEIERWDYERTDDE